MKKENSKKGIKKFDLEKMEFSKLKNLRVVKGGGGSEVIDTNNPPKGSSQPCDEEDQ